MLIPQGEVVDQPKLKGWNYDETMAIGKGSVGRFNTMNERDQHAILEAVNMITISDAGQGYYNTRIKSIKEICQILGYDFYEIGNRSTYNSLKNQEFRDRWQRIKRGYPTGFYYPLQIQK